MSACAAVVSWSELDSDIINEIVDRIDLLVDFVRFGSVCRSWRSTQINRRCIFSIILSEQRKKKDNNNQPQIPWLLLSSPQKPQSRYLYSLLEANPCYEIRVPEAVAAAHRFIGSGEGFLVFVDRLGEIYALNPLTGARIPLPSTAAQPRCGGVVRDPSSGEITGYLFYDAEDDEYITADLEFMSSRYYHKAVVSPGCPLHTVAVVADGLGLLSFAQSGDRAWTPIGVDFPPAGFADMIFRERRLYALHSNGEIAIFDLQSKDWSPVSVISSPNPRAPWSPRYLVESLENGGFFQVYKYVDIVSHPIKGGGKQFRPTTIDLVVFELDLKTNKWTESKSLGEIIFFLGLGTSLAFCSRYFPKLGCNNIYFTNDHRLEYIEVISKANHEVGVFNVEDRSIKPLTLRGDLQQLDWPPTIWFSPTTY